VKKQPESCLGWHFLPADRRVPRLGTLVEVGTKEAYEGKLAPCHSGLHFSPRVIDALGYAPGPILREVRVSGSIVMDTDKGVAAARETLWIDDVTPMLRAFGRWCAWTVRDKWNPPPIVLKYLREGLEIDRDAARDAAWAAAWDAARAAAWDAARDAAWDPARDAARAAAWAAAWDAAWAAAWDAARDAAWDPARDAARAAAWAAAWDAAWAAAWAAAWDAAWAAARAAQSTHLDRMVAEFREGRREWVWE
jgi:hypothetical protein